MRHIVRACETDHGARLRRREGPSHVVSPHGVSDVSHHAPPELVAAMVNAATASYQTTREAGA